MIRRQVDTGRHLLRRSFVFRALWATILIGCATGIQHHSPRPFQVLKVSISWDGADGVEKVGEGDMDRYFGKHVGRPL